ncbi:hypothetical protein CspeluHIS016_0406410 [Cutaneotrichosporon spelunceum]|uniref:Fe2OG dioxygenase domain-containing protein n=1 Tax=Cutaneotrichosporon spelunceum TaxID=1672016 RepID=A0AAD3TWQ1_9TREE|nr:hypothetical protein CspeluHIS016_0406410 [Cutaneotrichosporon spelunceum]
MTRSASSSSLASLNSLFDDDAEIIPASRTPPPIAGLYIFPSLLPAAVASAALCAISAADHFGSRDQVMLFSRPPSAGPSSLPPHLTELDTTLARLLHPLLPPETHALAFKQPLARQVILNLYAPGTGISPHIDLPNRYADGIVGVSLAGGCVMTFTRDGERHDVYLPPRSVYVMSGEARWEWEHGIAYRAEDVVLDGEERTVPRAVRLSVTLRWMKEGAGLLR